MSQTLVCWFCPLNVCNLLITIFVLISLSLQHTVANQMPFFEDTYMQMIIESWKSSLQLCSTDSSWRVRKGSALTLKTFKRLWAKTASFYLWAHISDSNIVPHWVFLSECSQRTHMEWDKKSLFSPCNKTMLRAYGFREKTIKRQCKLFLFFFFKSLWANLNPGHSSGRTAMLEIIRK